MKTRRLMVNKGYPTLLWRSIPRPLKMIILRKRIDHYGQKKSPTYKGDLTLAIIPKPLYKKV